MKENWIQEATEEMEKKGTKGLFTKKAKKRGLTTVEFAKKVLKNPSYYDEATRKEAQFMKNVDPKSFGIGGFVIGTAVGGYLGYKLGKSQERSDDVWGGEKRFLSGVNQQAKAAAEKRKKRRAEKEKMLMEAAGAYATKGASTMKKAKGGEILNTFNANNRKYTIKRFISDNDGKPYYRLYDDTSNNILAHS